MWKTVLCLASGFPAARRQDGRKMPVPGEYYDLTLPGIGPGSLGFGALCE